MGLARISEIVEKSEQIKEELKAEVFGQDKAVEDVIAMIIFLLTVLQILDS